MSTTTKPTVRRDLLGNWQSEATLDGTDWQIVQVSPDSDSVYFGMRLPDGKWSPVARFYFADKWREARGYPKWDKATFTAMVEAFVDTAGTANDGTARA